MGFAVDEVTAGDFSSTASVFCRRYHSTTAADHYFTCQRLQVILASVGRDSSVAVASRNGLDGLGIESRWGARFSSSVQTAPGVHPASYTMGIGSLSWGKAAGAWR